MPDEVVKVGIETEIKGTAEVNEYLSSLGGLESVKSDALNRLEASVKKTSATMKEGAKSASSLASANEEAAVATDKAAASQLRAELAAQRLATAQQRAATSAQNAALAQEKADAASSNFAAQQAINQEKLEQAATRNEIAQQRLANAQIQTQIQTDKLNAVLAAQTEQMLATAAANAELVAAKGAVVDADAAVIAAEERVAVATAELTAAKTRDIVTTAEFAALEGELTAANIALAESQLFVVDAANQLAIAQGKVAVATVEDDAVEKTKTTTNAGLALSFGAVATSVVALLGLLVLLAGVGYAITSSFVAAGEKVFELGRKSGLTASDVSALQFALKQVQTTADNTGGSLARVGGALSRGGGGSALVDAQQTEEGLNRAIIALDRYLRNANEAAGGNKKLGKTFDDLGINARQASENSGAALRSFFVEFSKFPEGAKRLDAAIAVAGRGGADLLTLVDQVGGDFDLFKKRAEELGVVISDKDAQAAHDFSVQLDEMQGKMTGLRNVIGADLIPAFSLLLTQFTDFLGTKDDIKNAADDIAAAFKYILVVLAFVVGAVQFVAQLIYGIVEIIAGVAVALYDLGAAVINLGIAVAKFFSGDLAGAAKSLEKAAGDASSAADDMAHHWQRAMDIISHGTGGFEFAFGLLTNPQVAPPKLPGPPKTKDFGGTSSGAKNKRYDPLDKEEKAQIESARQFQKEADKVALEQLKDDYGQRLVAISDYYNKVGALRDKDNLADITAAQDQVKRIQRAIASPLSKDPKEQDKLKAQLEEANRTLRLAEGKRNEDRLKTLREERDAIESVRLEYINTQKELDNLTGRFLQSDQLDTAEKFRKPLERVEKNLEGARAGLQAALGTGDTAAISFYSNLVLLLSAQEASLTRLKQQIELNNQFKQDQRDVAEIERLRGLDLDSLNRKLSETGATDDDATKQRRELMLAYQKQIDAVIARLELLKKEGLDNPDIQRTIDALKSGGKDTASVPLDEQAGKAKLDFQKINDEKQRLLDINALRIDSISKEEERLKIIDAYNLKLEEQYGIWKKIEDQRVGGPSEEFKQAGVEIQKSKRALIDFQQTLKTAAFASGLQNLLGFFTDIASGAKSLKDAAVDALSSFMKLIQQIIIQIFLLKAIQAITGIPVDVLLKFMGGTNFASGGGKKDGGLIQKRAEGGGFQIAPSGLLYGPGGPRDDLILAAVSPQEYILDAETTRNMTPELLDVIRATKGRVRGMFADGGAFTQNAINDIQPRTIQAGATSVEMTNVNYSGRKDIEQVISDIFSSSMGQRIFINQMQQNKHAVKAIFEGN